VQTSFRDVDRRTHRASVVGLVAVLRALGVEMESPADAAAALRACRRPTAAHQRRARPRRGAAARMPEIAEPSWGTFLPVYAIRTRGDHGVGSFVDLTELFRWTRELGGSAVGTLPLLAQFLDGEPFEYSPYSPASRLFWNELFVDLDATPEMAGSAEARDLAARMPSPRGRLVDYGKTWAAHRPVLEALSREFSANTPSARRRAFEAFSRARPELEDYCRFRAFGEQTGLPWQEWPAKQRAGRIGPRDADPERVRFHRYAQFVADEQLAGVGRTEPGTGLYLDLPLGVHGSSFDTWRYRDSFAFGASGGAPPDTFFTKGQSWGFPPLHPHRLADDDFRYVRACFRHLMRHAGVLRIDHVMGFHRLYWVPDGFDATHGVYVRSPFEQLYAVLAEEAHRTGTAVVGEDLGTVPRAVRAAMKRHGVLRSHVLSLEAAVRPDDPLPPAPASSLASLNTHDLAPFASFWTGADIDDRVDLGLLDPKAAGKERATRKRLVRALTDAMRAEGRLPTRAPRVAAPVEAAAVHLEYLAASPARMVIVNLEDLWGETEPQNRPGIYRERPNWRLRAARSFEEFRSDPQIEGRLKEVDRLRRERAATERSRRRRPSAGEAQDAPAARGRTEEDPAT